MIARIRNKMETSLKTYMARKYNRTKEARKKRQAHTQIGSNASIFMFQI